VKSVGNLMTVVAVTANAQLVASSGRSCQTAKEKERGFEGVNYEREGYLK